MIPLVEILRLHLRDEQLGEDVDLHDIASKTNHYSGSDLKGKFLYSNSLTNQVSPLRISCNGIRQRFLWQLQLDFAYTQWWRRNSWSSIRIGIPYSNYYVEQLWTCDEWSPTFIISWQSFRTTALAWPIQPQEDIGQAQWCEAANQWALREAYLLFEMLTYCVPMTILDTRTL